MPDLRRLFLDNETWLLDSALRKAKGPSPYLSALAEVWHRSFEGLTTALVQAIETGTLLEPGLEPNTQDDPIATFGRQEARQHRERGVSLDMLLGLLKLYRPAYLDLLREKLEEGVDRERALRQVDRFFDRVEVAFCRAWVREAETGGMKGLQQLNLELVTERDRYVTIFESIPMPILLLDPDRSVRNMNYAATHLFFGQGIPGAWYYRAGKKPDIPFLGEFFPRFFEDLEAFVTGGSERLEREWTATRDGNPMTFRVILSRMLDLPSTFAGILVILDNRTEHIQAARERDRLIAELTKALAEVKQLSGLLPICAWCKKIRDDQGYWGQIENYLSSRSDLVFSHGVCPDCARKFQPGPP